MIQNRICNPMCNNVLKLLQYVGISVFLVKIYLLFQSWKSAFLRDWWKCNPVTCHWTNEMAWLGVNFQDGEFRRVTNSWTLHTFQCFTFTPHVVVLNLYLGPLVVLCRSFCFLVYLCPWTRLESQRGILCFHCFWGARHGLVSGIKQLLKQYSNIYVHSGLL